VIVPFVRGEPGMFLDHLTPLYGVSIVSCRD
jgi:hypothetical protein